MNGLRILPVVELFTTLPVLFFVGVLIVLGVRAVAKRYNVVDAPSHKDGGRKIHKTPTALWGGVAVILTFLCGVSVWAPWLTAAEGYLQPKQLIGLMVAALVLLVGGALDDKYNLPPKSQILFPVFASLIIIAAGIGINSITNPFGGVIYLNQIQFTLFTWQGVPYHITLLADLFTFGWLMVLTYTTKFLDGLDGLVSGVSVIGLFTIAALCFTAVVWQPETGVIALLAAISFGAFLIFNWNPASMFLGESGSLFAGFILGVLAIISGGKIATALLVLGIPLLDVIWVIFRRAVIERRSPLQADRKHLHLRLIDAGLSQRQAVFSLYVLTALFGASSLYLQSAQKVNALVALVLVMMLIAALVVRAYRKRPLTS